MAAKTLNVPLTLEAIQGLKLGELVYLNGLIFTGSTTFHERARQGILPPIDFKKANVIFHVGPMMREVGGKMVLLSLAPTTSLRFDSYTPDLIKRTGIRAILGKTTMGKVGMAAMKEYGCVHLTKVGNPDNVLVQQTRRIAGIYFKDEVGASQCTLLLEVERFGPFVVSIDAAGNNLFYRLEEQVEKKMVELYAQHGITGFQYGDHLASSKWKEQR